MCLQQSNRVRVCSNLNLPVRNRRMCKLKFDVLFESNIVIEIILFLEYAIVTDMERMLRYSPTNKRKTQSSKISCIGRERKSNSMAAGGESNKQCASDNSDPDG